MKHTVSITTAIVIWFGLSSGALAQEFEGVITTRQLTLGDRALSMLLDPQAAEAERIDYRAVFALPMDRILEFAGQSDNDISVDSLVYSMKGTQLRVSGDVGDEMPGHAILDLGAGTFQFVQPAEKMYIELTREDFETYRSMTPEGEREAKPLLQARHLGQTKRINGMECSAYEIESGEWITVAWVTKELGDLVDAFVEFESRMKAMGMYDEEEDSEVFSLVAEHGFPVLEQTFRTFGDYGAEYEITEIQSVQRRSLSADLFAVPSDYEKLSIMEMLRLMGG
ncbi:MAG: hypothetical protein AMS21_06155 [Gemmatimonas sp. SG8_38_2]|nr:MAG: hypothetical protein AMS21_06155 [Gemmatimonas sp. SG8_38_2]